jgi:hypothetical protein
MKQHSLERTTAWLTTWSLILLVAVAQEDVHPDVVAVVDVAGAVRPTPLWASSYSDGENCYCLPSLDSAIGNFVVETPLGWLTTQEVCDLLGTGPGRLGQPLYNDIQCGNGPPNADENEFLCPGRTDIGETGCGQIGPKWNFDNANLADGPPRLPSLPEDIHPDIVAVIDVVGGVTPNGRSWADSYSFGNKCYCATTFDHDIADVLVETPQGWMTIRQACELLGPGPGIEGRPVYNDIQCGNGPPNNAGDEHVCPGRTDVRRLERGRLASIFRPLFSRTVYNEMPHHDASPLYNSQLGPEGCGQIGPRWNFDAIKSLPPGSAPAALPSSLAAGAVSVPMLPGLGVITGYLFCVLNWQLFDLVP